MLGVVLLLAGTGGLRRGEAQTAPCQALRWEPVTQLEDGTPLPEGVVPMYHVYTGPALDQLTRQVSTTQTQVACTDVPVVSGNYVVVTAVAHSLESAPTALRVVRAARVQGLTFLIELP
jgi:hypothetical protein